MFFHCLKIFIFFVLGYNGFQSLASNVETAGLVFYYGPTFEDHQTFSLGQAASILNHPKFVGENPTHCFMHGYTGSQEAYSTRLVIDSYLKKNSINLLAVNWTTLAQGSYIKVQRNLLELVPVLADSFLKLIEKGLNKESFTLVGHSLGAIGVGMIGREVFNKSAGSVLLSRVTALDPSNAAIHKEFILPPVDDTAAKFVDVIHTDAGARGSPARMGHADFWPNGGAAIQPKCPSDTCVNPICSHMKALAYWAESVANDGRQLFSAFRAKNYEEFLMNDGKFAGSSEVSMGLHCPTSARGDYFLKVESDYGSVDGKGVIV